MLGELSGEDETDRGLDLAGGHRVALVVLDQAAGLAGDPPEGVGDEGVEDGHGPLGDAGVRVYLLEDAVDVDVVGLPVLLPPGSGGTTSTSISGCVVASFNSDFEINYLFWSDRTGWFVYRRLGTSNLEFNNPQNLQHSAPGLNASDGDCSSLQ